MSNKTQHNYPKLESRILNTVLPNKDTEPLNGDFLEIYFQYREMHGFLRSRLWLWKQIFKSVPLFIINSIKWSFIMFNNYLKIVLRNIKRQKTNSFINMFGLAGGIACCLLIFLYVRFEFSYDKFNKSADRTYRVVLERKYPGRVRTFGLTANPLAETLINDFPEVIKVTRISPIGYTGREGSDRMVQVTYKEKTILEKNAMFADDSFFNVFSINLKLGDPETALEKPYSVVITEEIAKKYFGSENNAIEKTLTIEVLGRIHDYLITGISENVPANSHFKYNFLMSYKSSFYSERLIWRRNWACFTYIVLEEGTNPDILEAKLPQLVEKYLKPELEKEENINYDEYVASGNGYRFIMQPITDIHLKSRIEQELELNGDIKYVYLFALTAIFILILALINFINLITAQAANRAKEIGVRKTFGAFRVQLIKQFLFESTFCSFVSFFVACVLAAITIPLFNAVFDKNLEIGFFKNLYVILGLIGASLLIGIIAGGYPAFFLSAFKPVSVLGGDLRKGAKGQFLRNVLVIFQFTVSVGLITGTFAVKNQIQFLLNKDIGYKKEHVLVVENAQKLGLQLLSFQNEIKKYEKVISLTGCFVYPGGAIPSGAIRSAGANTGNTVSPHVIYSTDDDYIKTLGIDLIEGRTFSDKIASDSSSVIINESAVAALGLTEPVGKIITGRTNTTIIGVIRDFNFESLHHKVTPLLMFKTLRSSPRYIAVRIKPEDIQTTLTFIEKTWKSICGNLPFTYSFLDKNIELLYRTEQKVGKLISFFSLIALFIGCLGLFGLSVFTSEMRKKEISIRKVLGASVTNIVVLLSMDYIKLVTVSFIIAAPLSYFFLSKWLMNFTYNAKLNVWIFILAGVIAVAVAFFTTSFQTIKSAVLNPVNTLQSE